MAKKLAKALSDRESGLIFDAEGLKLREYLSRWLGKTPWKDPAGKDYLRALQADLKDLHHPHAGERQAQGPCLLLMCVASTKEKLPNPEPPHRAVHRRHAPQGAQASRHTTVSSRARDRGRQATTGAPEEKWPSYSLSKSSSYSTRRVATTSKPSTSSPSTPGSGRVNPGPQVGGRGPGIRISVCQAYPDHGEGRSPSRRAEDQG